VTTPELILPMFGSCQYHLRKRAGSFSIDLAATLTHPLTQVVLTRAG
jgi:hypothetical protein